jgi:hypothetical protein
VAKAVDRPSGDHVEFAAHGRFQHAVEGWAPLAVLGAAYFVGMNLDDLPACAFRNLVERSALVLDRLLPSPVETRKRTRF